MAGGVSVMSARVLCLILKEFKVAVRIRRQRALPNFDQASIRLIEGNLGRPSIRDCSSVTVLQYKS
ncbi:hypothetical protein FHK02_2147 [Spirosoma sp. LMG 31448]|uniref:Uncharacterized protein n=1 Tax=Spirosoma utsteinense TaxID=2585773 RepID=A0ABR6WDL4_9BACT|nr:hypothetical protein [Spirosoma utsteinense]MBC3794588.1 hypothetical protein [Spirosoma utsteinense]